MNKIKSIILDQTNWLEVNIENEEGIIVHCESFGDSDEYHELLRQRLAEFDVESTQELEDILSEQIANRHITTEEELEAESILKAEQELVRLKAEKQQRLNTLVVTTSNGNTFDGNLEARTNMTSAILSADLIGLTEEKWKLADNSIKLIQLSELKEALALAIQEVGNIVKEY